MGGVPTDVPTGVPTPERRPSDPSAPAEGRSGPDPAVMRRQYRHDGLAEGELAEDPFRQFARWFQEAGEAGVAEPNAMVLSTADAAGVPSSRTVLLKGYDPRGFVFYTNYGSRKGAELAANPYASLLFPWIELARQVVIGGRVEKVGRDETAAYFRTRPHGSRLGAWASEQSSPVAGREVLERRYAELAARYPEGEGVPVPPFWGGYRVVPRTVEFWQGRANRLHDRLRYVADGEGWRVERLCP
ncbi:pyridoxamine 5'-phosphate oxidase [Kitasatospora sp. NPDC088134]|uniref:pyridoxamine 5'-phosphate oxidase n=1 Tax=Kitasatospora sp. NPDC088134 TaxID=3364071 RepID=UPI0038089455